MAVETKQGGPVVTGAPVALGAGTGSVPTNGKNRRKRPSSLLAVASSLPSVESSLDEFIARANQTLVDASEWGHVEKAAKQEDEHRREADALRWKAAEQQLREGDVREQQLRRQLDGLQGRLAEAEARAAVATGGTSDSVVADLKLRLSRADERVRTSDDRSAQLLQELVSAKAAAAAAPAAEPFANYDNQELEDRVRIAEAKAAKAIAAARAAAAGLTVSSADIAAIESGLVVPELHAAKGTNWLAVFGAFVGGLAIMFGVSRLVLKNDQPAPAQAQVQQPAAAQVAPAPVAPAQPTKPIVTPIVTPIEEPPPPPPVQADVAPAVEVAPAPAVAKHHVAPAPAPAPKHAAPAPKQAPKQSAGIADPFGGGDAPKKSPKPAKSDKKAGGIVDPF